MSLDTLVKYEEMTKILYGLCVEAEETSYSDGTESAQKVIVIAGPTGCGKTDLSMMLAKMAGGEVVSADSMQVYRGMDIGTAKVTPHQRSIVPHHLIDICEVNQPFNVVDYCYGAGKALDSILSRNRVPIVTGGSGFYIHALLYGPPSGPPSSPELRLALEIEMEKLGCEALFNRVVTLDPVYAQTITCNDKQKIIRALEIMQMTQKRVSDLSWRLRHHPINYDFRCWFIHRPREVLHKRLEHRCDKMLAEGLLDEVIALEQQGLRKNHAASQAIGYRQALDYLLSSRSDSDYNDFVKQFKQATRQYVKRQFTWFRREPLFHWLDIHMHDPETAVGMILTDYERTNE